MGLFMAAVFLLAIGWHVAAGKSVITINMVLMTVLAPIVFFGLYLWALRTGMLLYKQARSGYVGSLFVWLCQLPTIVSPYFSYTFVVGGQFSLSPMGGQLGWYQQHWGSFFFFTLLPPKHVGYFINMVAVGMLILLLWLLPEKPEVASLESCAVAGSEDGA